MRDEFYPQVSPCWGGLPFPARLHLMLALWIIQEFAGHLERFAQKPTWVIQGRHMAHEHRIRYARHGNRTYLGPAQKSFLIISVAASYLLAYRLNYGQSPVIMSTGRWTKGPGRNLGLWPGHSPWPRFTCNPPVKTATRKRLLQSIFGKGTKTPEHLNLT